MTDQMGNFTFLNYDASHRSISGQDLFVINRHINTHIATKAKRPQKAKKRLGSPRVLTRNQVFSLGIHIGGLRSEPFDILPIGNKGYIPEAFDYCEHYQTSTL